MTCCWPSLTAQRRCAPGSLKTQVWRTEDVPAQLAGGASCAYASGPFGNPRFHDAAEFFLVDLYGPRDLSRHIENVRRILPVMTNVLPEYGLATVAHAVELNVLSESLDGAMVEALGADAATINDATYAAAYRKVDRAEDRKRQIDLIALLGEALDKLTHQRFIGAALKMMRKPAELAGLGELQGFLERGYRAFGAMRGGASEFVSIVVARERAISETLFAGDDSVLGRRPQS